MHKISAFCTRQKQQIMVPLLITTFLCGVTKKNPRQPPEIEPPALAAGALTSNH